MPYALPAAMFLLFLLLLAEGPLKYPSPDNTVLFAQE